MLWAVIDPTADGSLDTVFPNVILRVYSCVPLFLNFQEVCNFQVVCRPLAISSATSATKAGPLSDPIDTGIPN
jgi:hypothetical protein